MSWFRVDDQSAFDEKVLAAGDDGWGLLCRAGAWSSAYGTDGVIPLPTASALCGSPARWKKLVAVGLIEKKPDAFVIVKFLKWNPTAASVRAERERKRSNLNAHRDRTRNRPETGFTTGHETGLKPVSQPDSNRGEITVPIPIPIPDLPEPSSPLLPPENRRPVAAATAGFQNPAIRDIEAALREAPALAHLAIEAFAARLAQHCREHGFTGRYSLAAVVASVREASAKVADLEAAGEVLPKSRIAALVVGCVKAGPRAPARASPGLQPASDRWAPKPLEPEDLPLAAPDDPRGF